MTISFVEHYTHCVYPKDLGGLLSTLKGKESNMEKQFKVEDIFDIASSEKLWSVSSSLS